MTPVPDDEPRPSFYAAPLTEEERAVLEEARKIQGIDEEIAMLRFTLRRHFASRPRPGALAKDAAALANALAVRHRLNPKSTHDLAEHVTQALQDLAEQIIPNLPFPDDL